MSAHRLVVVVAALAVVGCSKSGDSSSSPPVELADSGADAADALADAPSTDANDADTSDASDSGDAADGDAGHAPTRTFQIEIRDAAIATFSASGSTLSIALDLKGKGFGFFNAAPPLVLTGKVSAFPEAEGTLYTATTVTTPLVGGPCGDTTKVSLALSLFERDAVKRSAGSLTAYCGDGVFVGVPLKVLRLVELKSDAGP